MITGKGLRIKLPEQRRPYSIVSHQMGVQYEEASK
jgi:hypothetical protein